MAEQFNEYDSLVEDTIASTTDQANKSLYATADINPDSYAEATRLANENKVPVKFVNDNLEKFKQMKQESSTEYDSMLANNPKLTEYISNIDNAAVAKDDLESLKKHEDLVSKHNEDSNWTDAVAVGFSRLNKSIANIPMLAYNVAAMPQNLAMKALGYEDRMVSASTFRDVYTLPDYFEKQEKYFAAKVPELEMSIVDEAISKGDLGVAANVLAKQIISNSPQQAVTIALALSGFGSVALTQAGITAASDKQMQNEQQGIDPLTGTTNALTTGAYEVIFEKFGTLSGLDRAAKTLAKTHGSQAARQIISNTIKSFAVQAGEEGLSEAATTAAEGLTDYYMGIRTDLKSLPIEMIDSGLIGAGSGAAMSSPGSLAVSHKSFMDAKRAETNRNFYLSLMDGSKDSKLRQRLPEKHQQYVEHLTQGGPVENIYIDSNDLDVYFQSQNLDSVSVMAELGLSKEYSEAKELGIDLKIKTSDFVQKLVDTEYYQGLAGDIKFNTEDLSANQAKKQQETLKEFFQQEVTQEEVEKSTYMKDVFDQLVAAGESESTAREQVKVFKFFEYIAKETGSTPEAVAKQYGLRIQKGQAPVQRQEMPGAPVNVIETKTKIDESGNVLEYDNDVVSKIESDFSNAEAGQRIFSEQAQKNISVASTFPEYAKNKGYKKKDILNLVNKIKAGETLTEAQKSMFDSLYLAADESVKRGEMYQAQAIFNNGIGNYPSEVDVVVDYGKVFKSVKNIKQGIIEKLAGKTFTNKHSGYEIELTGNGLRKASQILSDEASKRAMLNLPKLIENAVFARVEKDPKGRGNDTLIFYAPMRTTSKEFVIKIEARKQANGKLFADKYAVENEKSHLAVTTDQTVNGQVASKISFADFAQDIKKIKTNLPYFQTDTKKQDDLFQTATALPTAEVSDLGFYSKMEQMILAKVPNNATPDQILATLKEVKPEELEWSGIKNFLKGKTKVNKEELVNFVRANNLQIREVTIGDVVTSETPQEGDTIYTVFTEDGEGGDSFFKYENAAADVELNGGNVQEMEWDGQTTLVDIEYDVEGAPTKFEQYTLPGGENYREVLLTLPPRNEEITELPNDVFVQQRKTALSFGDQDPEALKYFIYDKEDYTTRELLGQGDTLEQATEQAITKLNRLNKKENNYTSSHFDQKNILAHTRLKDRIDADGKKVLFVEEIQSDWHQAGRKHGYKIDETALIKEAKQLREERDKIFKEDPSLVTQDAGQFTNDLIELNDEEFAKKYPTNPRIEEIDKRVGEIEKELRGNTGKLPNAPFKKNWHEFVFKRILKMAVDGGYERISWTTGEQQAERFDLSKDIDRIIVTDIDNSKTPHPTGGTTGLYLNATTKQGGSAIDRWVKDKTELSDYIGKEMAEKIFNPEYKSDKYKNYEVYILENADLKIGGEGMKGFYDKILVDYANKIGKKFGTKVIDTKVETGKAEASYWDSQSEKLQNALGDYTLNDFEVEESRTDEDQDSFRIPETDIGYTVFKTGARQGKVRFYSDRTGAMNFQSLEKFQEALNPVQEKSNFADAHTLEITPELEAQINQGQELYQGESIYRGSYNPKERLIKLFNEKNKSTFLHESAHFFLDVFGDSALNPNASAKLKADYEAVLKYLGVESREEIQVEHHEKFARSFEAYLREGKSPSIELKKAFNSFKKWLTKIYPLARQLDVELSDDVRGVFDRMLASEQEIEDAANDVKPFFTNLEVLGFSKEDIEKYLTALEDAKTYAEGKLYSKFEKQFELKQSKELNAKIKELFDKNLKQLKEDPAYNIVSILSKGKDINGNEVAKVKINSDSLANYPFIGEIVPKNMKSKDGIAVELVAEMFGYKDVSEFINLLINTKDINDVANEQAEIEARIEFPELNSDPKDDAKEALANTAKEDLLRLELEYMLKNDLPVFKNAIKKTVRRVPTKQAVKDQARSMVGKIAVKDIRPFIYQRAMVKAAREAGALLAKGDLQGAFDAKLREYLNHELYLAANEAQEYVDKSLRKFKKIDKTNADLAEKMDVDLLNAAKSILSRFGIGKETNDNPLEYLNKVKEYDPQKYDVIKAYMIDAVEGAGHYEDVSFNDFEEMRKAVEAIIELARGGKQIEINDKKIDFETAKGEIIGLFNSKSKSGKDGLAKTKDKHDQFKTELLSGLAALKRVEFIADFIDEGNINGVFRTYFWQPVSDASAKYRIKKEEVINKYKNINEKYKDIFAGGPIRADEIGFEFRNKGELLMALLHTGNESNKSKLLRGRGWGEVNLDGTLDSTNFDRMIQRFMSQSMVSEKILTKQDMDYVQEIWDLMESMKPESQKAHKEMYGYYFNEITAQEIITPWGNYRGGYIPAKVDVYENEDAKIRSEKNEFEESGLGMSFMYPSTGRGFTKSRIDAYAAPLSLDLNKLGAHIDSVMRFTYVEPVVKQTAKLVYNKEIRAAMSAYDPDLGSKVLIPWLQRAAGQRTINESNGIFKVLDKAAAYLRSSVAMQIMVGNVSNALQQFTGVVVAASKVKPKHLLNSMYEYTKSPRALPEMMLSKSDYMQSTQGSNIYEAMARIEEISTNPNTFETVREFSKKHTYFLQSAFQNTVNTIVWSGAYDQAIAEGLDEKSAVRSADAAVRQTQGSVLPEDVSAFEVGSPTYRLFTQFAGYFNMLLNLNATEMGKIYKAVGLKKGASRLFYVYMMSFAAPAILSDLIVKTMRGQLGADDDDEEILASLLDSFFGSQFRTATAMAPIVGPLANTVVGKFTDQPYDDKLSLSPVLSILESTAGIPAQVYKGLSKSEVNEKKILKDSLMLAGVLSNLPIAPVGKPLGYLIDVDQGKARPTGPIDFGRGLITGQPGNK